MTEQPRTILIVDDEPMILKLVGTHLSKQGYQYLEARSGEEALRRAAERPDLILLDIGMPDIDGFETCRRLKENEATRDIPIIFLSGDQTPNTKAMGLESGGVDYVTKPFDARELLARVNSQLTLRDRERQLRAYTAQLEERVEERTRQLIHVDRLVTLGTFSAGLAHEISSPLTYLRGNVDLAKLSLKTLRETTGLAQREEAAQILETVGEVEKHLEKTRDASFRISRILDSLKSYAHKGEARKEKCQLIDTVNDALTLLHHKLKHGVSVELEVSPEIEINCDRQKISQVFVNLINNSINAMEDNNGKIHIRGESANGRVEIQVKDNGRVFPQLWLIRFLILFLRRKVDRAGLVSASLLQNALSKNTKGRFLYCLREEEGLNSILFFPFWSDSRSRGRTRREERA